MDAGPRTPWGLVPRGQRMGARRAVVLGAAGGIVLVVFSVLPAAAEQEPDLGRILEAVRPAWVKVRRLPQYSKGKAPGESDRWGGSYRPWMAFGGMSGGALGQALREHRAAESGGLLISEDTVLTGDLTVHPRFVERIEVEAGGRTYPAAVSAVAVSKPACFLKLASRVEGGASLAFDPKAAGPYYAVAYGRREGRWTASVSALDLEKNLSVDETGRRWRSVPPQAVVVNGDGVAVGVSMTSRLPTDDSWKGSPMTWDRLSADQLAQDLQRTEALAAQGVLTVRLTFRLKVTSDEAPMMWSPRVSAGETITEKNVLGVAVSPEVILVLAKLDRPTTARLETITVSAGGENYPAEFVGTLERYGALLVRLAKGAGPLKSLVLSDEHPARELHGLLLQAQIDCRGDRRVAYYQHDRCESRRVGRDGLVWPRTSTGAQNAFYFDRAGHLVAVPLGYREKTEAEPRYYGGPEAVVCPVTFLKPILADPRTHFDPAIVPLSEREEKRLVWLGIEGQALTEELAKLKRVSELTRGGSIGLLITYVYPDSPAVKAGVKVGDVLVHLYVAGEPKPLQVTAEAIPSRPFPWDRLDEVPEEYLDRIPQPWPSRLNSLTSALTALGPGKKVTAVFVRDGQERPIDFLLELAPDDFRSTEPFKHQAMGLTVKDITYELRRYYRLATDEPGVVVARVEPGGKAAVAKVRPYEIITDVNGKPIRDSAEFRKATAEAGEYQLAIRRMQRRRLVKLTITPEDVSPKTDKKQPEGTAAP